MELKPDLTYKKRWDYYRSSVFSFEVTAQALSGPQSTVYSAGL
jgi:hypothetical protein